MPDSASSLSHPYTNELVNSLIKASVYIDVGSEDSRSFSVAGGFGALNAECDFRKSLHVFTNLVSVAGPFPRNGWVWGCQRRAKLYPGTRIVWVSLAKFNVSEFKLVSTPHTYNPFIWP